MWSEGSRGQDRTGYELDRSETEVGDLQKHVHKTAWRSENDVGLLRERFELGLDRLSAHQHAGTETRVVTHLVAHAIGLVRQLASRREHDPTHSTGQMVLSQLFHQRHQKRCGLAAAYMLSAGKRHKPVRAMTTTSLPCRATGIAARWMGVGILNPSLIIPARTGLLIPIFGNVPLFFERVFCGLVLYERLSIFYFAAFEAESSSFMAVLSISSLFSVAISFSISAPSLRGL